MFGQRRDVLGPLAQRRDADADHVDAVVEVMAEGAARDLVFERSMGRRDAAARRPCRVAVSPSAPHFAALQEAQQPHLHRRRHLADFVEEQRAAVRLFEQAFAIGRWRR